MTGKALLGLSVGALLLGSGWSGADEESPFPHAASFSTLITTPLAIEGLTGDDEGNLYTTGRATSPTRCPVWRVGLSSPSLEQIGSIPNPSGCNPSGLAFDHDGNLYVADAASGGVIWRLSPGDMDPVTPFATGVPGTNGLAFDRDGNLWTGDGTTGQGRVWKITADGTVSEVFRIPPMRNSTALGGGLSGDGVGRQARTFPPGLLANSLGGQDLVANGLAFNRRGDLFIADTARGAIWRVRFDHHGNVRSRTGCDTTVTENTLCLDNVYVAHPFLEGTDGIALDREGNIWNSANERNAIVVVTEERRVREIFRNAPDPVTKLRNEGPLELPTSPFLLVRTFCTANSDGNRRDNSPNTDGEITPAGPNRGKISCMDQKLPIRGLPLPVE